VRALSDGLAASFRCLARLCRQTMAEANILVLIGLTILTMLCAWRLVTKTGHSGVLSFLLFVPIVNVVLCLYFALCEWPIERQLRRHRDHHGELPPEDSEEALVQHHLDLPAESAPDSMATDVECPRCGETIPAVSDLCPKCGWTYRPGSA